MIVMEVLILGVGDAFTARYFGSSALVRSSDGACVLIDCPDLIHRALREAADEAGWSVDLNSIDDILLTHLHGDHSNGLESFGFWRRLARETPPETRAGAGPSTAPRLWATLPVGARVWQKLAPAMDGPFLSAKTSQLADFFDLRRLEPGRAVTVGGMQVECRYTGHPVPTVGLRITDGSATLGWSSDTPFERAHIDWLAEADLIIHETNLGSAHTPIERLNELPDDIRGRMRLIHILDDFDPRCTDIHPLRQGEVLTINSRAAV